MSGAPAETIPANGTEFVSWRHCEVHTRSTFKILSLCLSTLVICVWNAVHPDVPFPTTPRWKVYRMRLYGFLVGLFLPEVLVLNAFDEFIAARELLQKINGTESESLFTIPYWTKLLKDLYPRMLTIPYWTEAWKPNVIKTPEKPQWSMTQVFYALMGGFFAKSNDERITVLSPNEIETIWRSGSSMQQLLAADGIEDHSKAGALAKALFCWQLLVFAISCIARRAEHLPLSLLEITTLAHSLCGLAAFALWWRKPHSVDEVVFVPVDESLAEKIDWDGFPDGLSGLSAIGGINILIDGNESLPKAVLSSLAVAVLYGLPHLIALGTEFPTLAERRCWEVATAILIGEPLFLVVFVWVSNRAPWISEKMISIIAPGLFTVYCIASCFIIAESFRQLFALPAGAFLSPAFVCYLPHFS